MTTIEYNKVKVSVPDTWDDITLGDYEKINGKTATNARERVALVAEVCKVDEALLLEWPAEVFNLIVSRIGFLFVDAKVEPSPYIEVDGMRYIVPIEEKLTLGAWIDAEEVQKESTGVLTGVLAIVCRPAGEAYNWENNEERRAMFATLPVSRVLPVLAFFLRYKVVLEQRTKVFSKISQSLDQLAPNIRSFVKPGGGIKLSRIYRAVVFWSLTALLRYRWAKFLRTYSIVTIRSTRKRRKNS